MDNIKLDNIAGLKVEETAPSAELIKTIRNHTGESMTEIKDNILNSRYVFSCSFTDDDEKYADLIKLHDERIELGYKVSLYDDGELSTIEYFRNWQNTVTEISEEIDADDLFGGDEEYRLFEHRGERGH